MNFQKIQKIGIFTVFWGDLKDAGTLNPPLKLHPEAPPTIIRVNALISSLYCPGQVSITVKLIQVKQIAKLILHLRTLLLYPTQFFKK